MTTKLGIVPNTNGQADPAPPAADPAPLIDLAGVAAMLSLSPDSVARMEQNGRLGPVRVQLGRAVRFRRQECLDWIMAGCPRRDSWKWKPQTD
jgi:predicted DNA-binding transcriptional regulator AlpA